MIVGCGCRGREVGRRLGSAGWEVRGTSRTVQGTKPIRAAGIEPAVADPELAASILDHVADVTIVFWLLGSAAGAPGAVAAIHGPRLERLLERLVDTPVRGFVYEAAGTVDERRLEEGGEIVRAAGERWRIPVALVTRDPGDLEPWTAAMAGAAARLTSGGA